MLSLTDEELAAVMDVAAAIPVGKRDAFLQALAVEFARYEGVLGVGLISRIGRALQAQFHDRSVAVGTGRRALGVTKYSRPAKRSA
jgi:hypothetical protein